MCFWLPPITLLMKYPLFVKFPWERCWKFLFFLSRTLEIYCSRKMSLTTHTWFYSLIFLQLRIALNQLQHMDIANDHLLNRLEKLKARERALLSWTLRYCPRKRHTYYQWLILHLRLHTTFLRFRIVHIALDARKHKKNYGAGRGHSFHHACTAPTPRNHHPSTHILPSSPDDIPILLHLQCI